MASTGMGLLPDEPGILIQRNVIRALGGHDLATFVQQVHYSTVAAGLERDGYRWAVRSIQEWCDDCVLTPRQLERLIGKLVKAGVIVRWQPPETMDRRAWTRVDMDVLAAAMGGMHHHQTRGHSPTKRVDTGHANGGDVPYTRVSTDVTTETPRATSLEMVVPDPFDEFWQAYPRKVGKPDAHKVYRGLAKSTGAAAIMEGLTRWRAYWVLRNEPEFIPHPATWLRQHRFNDPPPPVTARRGGQVSTMDKLRQAQFDENGNMLSG